MMWGVPFRDTWLNIFDTPKPYFNITDCLVDFETGLIYKDGDVVWETANENMVWIDGWPSVDSRWINRLTRQDVISERMNKLKNYFEEKINNQSEINEINEGTCLHLLHPFNRYVFGHLFDTLQKMQVVDKEGLHFDSILLPRVHEIINFNIHMEVLNIQAKNRIESDLRIYKIKNLIYVCPPSHPTSFTPETYDYVRNKYSNLLNLDLNSKPVNKLFLTRRKGKFNRYLINEIEILPKLMENGITVLDGSEDFRTIANLFSNSSHIAGVHGSLFTNNIFGNNNTKYLEYCPRRRENHTFHHQYKKCNSYDHVLVDGDDDHNIILSMEKLIEFYNNK